MGKHHIWGHFSIAKNVWGIWNMAWRGIWGSSSIRGEISLSSPSLAPTLTSPCNFFWHINSHGLAFDWIILEKSKNNCTLIHIWQIICIFFENLKGHYWYLTKENLFARATQRLDRPPVSWVAFLHFWWLKRITIDKLYFHIWGGVGKIMSLRQRS